MRTKSLILAIAAMLALPTMALVPAATAHTPPAPNLNCDTAQAEHDWALGGGVSVFALGRTRGAGITTVFEGSVNCPLEDICVDLSDGEDVDGDGNPDTPDLPEQCAGQALIPGSDGDFEFGIGGAFLPATHHSATVTVTSVGPSAFSGGSDGDDDGTVDGANDPVDCLSGILFANGGAVTLTDEGDGRTCPAGMDGGWWIFVDGCGVTTGDDGELWLDDTDNDGIPDSPHFVPPSTSVAPNAGCGTIGHAG